MNCTITEERLLDYLEGSLDHDARQELEAHLDECPECRAELERWRGVERQIGEGIGIMMANQNPTQSVREILGSAVGAKRKGPRRFLGMIAAGFAVIVLLSPLFLPFSARVLASTPLIGGYFATAIAESGLAVAYQAGLVTELNQSVTNQELTLTVMGAYADATQTTVMFTISGEKERMQQLWDDLPRTREQVSLRDSLGREYTGHSSRSGYFDEETGQYHVFLETNALPFYVGRLKLHVQMVGKAMNTDWGISFPVQRVSDKLTMELKINQRFTTGDGVPVQIDKLVFSPSRTVLHYSMQWSGTPDFHFPRWSITADGKNLAPLGGGGGGSESEFKGTAAFFPTSSKELTIGYEGLMGSHALNWRLEMIPGSSATWHDIDFTIDEIKAENGETRVKARMQGGFIKFEPVLELADGTTIRGKILDFKGEESGDAGVLEVIFPGSADINRAWMVIERGEGLLPDPWTTTITRP